ncbi:acyl-CoA dehydrogenase family protein [Rhizobium leguminosarum]|uniref:acyl-CoA dehydrogenase family protein n=1 Tax=Rhizobium leguminosarum TaxID=384 RepID=UPI003F9695ED
MNVLVNSTREASLDELLERARQLRSTLQERAGQTEIDGRVSTETTNLLKQASLLRLGQPKRFGGNGYPPSSMFRLGFELGRGCGSTAWCAMVANMSAALVSSWTLEAQQDVWANPENLACAIIIPTGRCEQRDGGFELAGQWPYASNCDNSDWVVVAAPFPSAEGQPPDMGMFLLPASQFRIDHQAWNVAGMQGTGSKTLHIESPVFVPDHRIVRFSDLANGTAPGRALADNNLARLNFSTFGSVALVSTLLGMAQGALDYFEQAMTTKVKRSLGLGAPAPVALSTQAQVSVGAVSAAIDGAALLLLDDLGAAEAKIWSGDSLTVGERVRLRRNIGFATAQASNAVNLLFEAAGAGSTALNNPIQRHWRDINVAARHMHLDAPAIFAIYGQQRFGLTPQGAY